MPGIFDPTDLTFNGQEVSAISEAVFISAFKTPALEELHTVVTGIVAKKQIAILGQLNGLLGQGDDDCGPVSSDNTFDATEKFWEPVPISDRLEQCWKDLVPSFWLYTLKPGVDKADITATDFLEYILSIMEVAVIEAVYRFVWFGDTAADTVANGGVLKNGTNKKYFDKLDGLFVQLFAIVAADADRKTAGLATKNAAATFALQKFDTTDRTNLVVTNVMDNMTTDADDRLQLAEDKLFIVTKSVFDQYVRELKFANAAYTTERIEKGIMSLTVDGVTVMYFQLWDRIIKTYLQNGTKYSLPHRILLTTKGNIQVGTQDAATLTTLKPFNDPVSRKTYIDFAFNLDAKIILDHMVQLAY
jgi:hypothetical protein